MGVTTGDGVGFNHPGIQHPPSGKLVFITGVAVGVGSGRDKIGGDVSPKYSDIVTTSNCPASSLLFKKSLMFLKSETLYCSGVLFPTIQHSLSLTK